MSVPAFNRPIIVLAAPRSGSTLLFETLAQLPGIWTIGGESHQLIEGIRELNPLYGEVDSNRLGVEQASDWIVALLRKRFAARLQNRDRHRLDSEEACPVRFLEKTPKNALRQPFLETVFPGALYIFLYRDPRQNLSSMIEAWKSRKWVTYPQLPGWQGPPWSLLLPPGWQTLDGSSIAEICAFQWSTTNRMILEDLSHVPRQRWFACSYEELLNDTAGLMDRICAFADLESDERFENYISQPLPLSRYTHTKPSREKWLRNESLVVPLLDQVMDVWNDCNQLAQGSGPG
jgi:hypothetical protein